MTHFTDWYFVATLLATQFIDNVVLLRINRDFAPAIKDTKPSHYRPIQLYSRGRLYLTIDEKGKVGSTENGKNPDCKFNEFCWFCINVFIAGNLKYIDLSKVMPLYSILSHVHYYVTEKNICPLEKGPF